ncbi:carcinoembryonic antigen-related cell adhesion molecule 5 [Notothenia coriiceps]|uniref:Carcinoembryonic antigen-related cell adhesion molecule 5 n=1 Tax=Notothenia coriiceps TaxID=8208 RepID=A0A6I9MEB8_9TELE|nr:PREDICTED: carcinoembryonic antigen-related cell adhesion molecule 5 [Notothenia coriiceps]
MTQPSSTASTCATRWKMWLFKVLSVICFTAVCAAQAPEDATPSSIREVDMTIPTTTPYERPVPTVARLSSWLDVFPSEKVEFDCNVNSSSDWTFTWYRNAEKLQDIDPNVTASGSKLMITATTTTYSGSYSCKGHHKTRPDVTTETSAPVQLKVYPNPPKPTLTRSSKFNTMFPGESVTFTCKVDASSGWRYLWYHNNTEIQTSDPNFRVDINHSKSGQYHCKAKRGKSPFFTEVSEATTLQVSDPPKPFLKLLSPWMDVFENETVEFSCEVESDDWMITWYRNEKEVHFEEDLNVEIMDSSLNITSVTQAYQGNYSCKAELESRKVIFEFSNTADLRVYGNTPKPTVSKVPTLNPMYVGETVNFTCKVIVSSGWEYQWYRNGVKTTTGETISIPLSLSNQYWCMAYRGDTTQTEFSDKMQQDVLEIPVPSLKRITPWLDVFPTEGVKLSCGMDGSSNWTYTWFRDGQLVTKDDALSFDSDAANLSISSASASQRGQYSCSAQLKSRSVSSNSSSETTLEVYDTKPRVTLMQNPKHNVMYTGDAVTFSCHVNVSSGWEYLWHKDGRPLSEYNHNISSVVTTNTSYQCQVKRGTNTAFHSDRSQAVGLEVKERPKANIILLTGWSEVFSTDSLALQCEMPKSQDLWNYTWFKEGRQINHLISEKHTVTPQNNTEQSLYTCQGIRSGRPSYSKFSESFTTKNLLLKRRVLLSISGLIFFGIIAVLLGCIFLRVFRKPDDGDDKPEETELFLTMAQLKERDDAPCPMVQYITDAELNSSPKEGEENGTACSETPLPITSHEDQAVTIESSGTTENNGGLVSFKQ